MHTTATAERPFDTATHNGIITVKSGTSGDHRTVKISTQPADSTFAPGERVAKLLTGRDNEESYTTFAFIQPNGRVCLFRRHRESKFYQWLARFLETPERFTDKVDINFDGRCRRCNRTLTTPESVASGIGPTCAGRE